MMPSTRTIVAVLAVVLMGGCPPPGAHVGHGLEGGTYFLCCTLRFDADREATDAGYVYEPGTTLPAGTEVQVVHDEDRMVTLRPVAGNEQYKLYFRFGRKAIGSAQYFQEILLRDDPRAELQRMPPEVADAVARGELQVGMTKAQALAARSYPPRHRTPSTDDDEWVFYQSRAIIWQVRFEAGRLAEINPGKAPGS